MTGIAEGGHLPALVVFEDQGLSPSGKLAGIGADHKHALATAGSGAAASELSDIRGDQDRAPGRDHGARTELESHPAREPPPADVHRDDVRS